MFPRSAGIPRPESAASTESPPGTNPMSLLCRPNIPGLFPPLSWDEEGRWTRQWKLKLSPLVTLHLPSPRAPAGSSSLRCRKRLEIRFKKDQPEKGFPLESASLPPFNPWLFPATIWGRHPLGAGAAWPGFRNPKKRLGLISAKFFSACRSRRRRWALSPAQNFGEEEGGQLGTNGWPHPAETGVPGRGIE